MNILKQTFHRESNKDPKNNYRKVKQKELSQPRQENQSFKNKSILVQLKD